MNANTNSEQIIEWFEDDSFPSMVLIDGGWGSGKTHYVENDLIPFLENRYKSTDENFSSCHYMSLYGVSSIDDFRDRIISSSLSESGNSKNFKESLTKIADSMGTLGGEKGIGGLLNGVSGAFKYNLYSNLANKTFILDDLERVSDKQVVKNILGECFNLVDTKSNLEVIIIANTEEIESDADLEKVFQDKISIKYTAEEIVQIALTEYEDLLDPALSKKLVQFIRFSEKLILTNIRVLKRALSRFKKLKEKIEIIESVAKEIAYEQILKQVIAVCYARYELNYSVAKIKEESNSKSILLTDLDFDKTGDEVKLSADEKKKDECKKQLRSILSNINVHVLLIDYCCENQDNFTDIITELNLPITTTALDQLLNYPLRFKMKKSDFDNGVIKLISYIQKKESLDFVKFFNCCDCLITLLEKEYIEIDLTKEDVLIICEEVELKYFIADNMPNRYSVYTSFENEDIKSLFNSKFKYFQNHLSNSEHSDFKESFKKSFDEATDALYKNYEFKPFLHNFTADELIVIFINWTEYSIYQFTCFMHGQYQMNNPEDFFEPEYETLITTLKLLKDKISKLTPSCKKGVLNILAEGLDEITNRMTEKLKQNKPTSVS